MMSLGKVPRGREGTVERTIFLEVGQAWVPKSGEGISGMDIFGV